MLGNEWLSMMRAWWCVTMHDEVCLMWGIVYDACCMMLHVRCAYGSWWMMDAARRMLYDVLCILYDVLWPILWLMPWRMEYDVWRIAYVVRCTMYVVRCMVYGVWFYIVWWRAWLYDGVWWCTMVYARMMNFGVCICMKMTDFVQWCILISR